MSNLVYYRGGKVSWGDYLLAKSVNNLQKFVKSGNGQLSYKISETNHKLTDIQTANSNMLNAVNNNFGIIQGQLDNINISIDSFHTDFNYAMTMLLTKTEVALKNFSSMIEKLDNINNVLEHPTKIKAVEFREIAIERLKKGLLNKALEAFLESEKFNDTDFIVQLQIGKLYLYGKDNDNDVINIKKARNYLKNASRYSYAEYKYNKLEEVKQKSVEAYFHASVACYVLANCSDENESKKLTEEALQLIEKAIELNPNFSLAHFHKAKYAALLEKNKIAVNSLTVLLNLDYHYIKTIWNDPDLSRVREDEEIKKVYLGFINKCNERYLKLIDIIVSLKKWDVDGTIINKAQKKIDSYSKLNKNNILVIPEMFDILSENNINYYSQHLEKRKKQIKDERASWINKNNNLLKVLKISSGETNQFYNKIKEHSTVRDDYDNLTNDIFQLKKIYEQLKSIHNDIKIKENKALQVEREKEKREEEIKLRLLEKEQRTKDILNKIGYLIVILGPLIGVIYYLLNFNRFESTIWTYYLPSTIIFVSFFIGSLFKSLSSPNVLSKIHHIFGICLIAPLIYLAVILVVAIILLIPAFIAMIIWDSSIVDKITDWVLTAGYFLTVLLEWGASFNIFHESD